MADKSKSALAILVGSPKGEPMGDDDTSDDPKAKKLRAVKRLRQAFKSGDDEAAAMAFHDAVEACESAGYDDEEESDEGEEKDPFGGN